MNLNKEMYREVLGLGKEDDKLDEMVKSAEETKSNLEILVNEAKFNSLEKD